MNGTNAGGEVAIGLDLGGTNIKAGIVNGAGEMLRRWSLPTQPHQGGEALLQRVGGVIKTLEGEAMAQGWRVRGAGIGSAGQVDSVNGVVKGATANLPGWAGMKLGSRLASLTGLPVSVDNDANAMAFGEAWVGAGRRWRDFVCVTLGTGVGGCLVINRRPYRGLNGYAGEIGHHVIVDGGRPCNCGRSGCFEQYASVTALMGMVRDLRGEADGLNLPENVFAAAGKGQEPALGIIGEYARNIAVGLANLVHLFDPEGIVIGGAVTKQGELLLNPVRRELAGFLLPVYGESPNVEIVAARLGDDGGVIGAAAGFFET
ncbi:ROK family protein [Paenibacillus macerans]|uniref:ROK family protein n=1 Tax=Paenibacillus macerans TaxID=44252 RepID=UPI003D3118AD